LAKVASAAIATSKMRIASISVRVCSSFLSSVEGLHGSLGEPLERAERCSRIWHVRNVPPTSPDIALIPRVDNDLAPVAAFLQVAVGIGRSL
jgi:hypothetical protein